MLPSCSHHVGRRPGDTARAPPLPHEVPLLVRGVSCKSQPLFLLNSHPFVPLLHLNLCTLLGTRQQPTVWLPPTSILTDFISRRRPTPESTTCHLLSQSKIFPSLGILLGHSTSQRQARRAQELARMVTTANARTPSNTSGKCRPTRL